MKTLLTMLGWILTVGLGAGVLAYIHRHRETRFERLVVAIAGALAGSLIGRILANPQGVTHVAYITAGAFVFCAIDWMLRPPATTPPSTLRTGTKPPERSGVHAKGDG
jgi:uncharacterized membrane protein YfcA